MKNAALQAMEKIKLYYQKTDATVFTVATLIDPRLKLFYHKEHKWEKSFIDAAREQFEMVFKNHYYQPPMLAGVVDEIEDDLFTQGRLSLPPMPFCIFLFRLFGVLSGDPVKLERRKEKEQI